MVLFYLLLFETGFLCVALVVLELALYTRLALDSQRFTYLGLQSGLNF